MRAQRENVVKNSILLAVCVLAIVYLSVLSIYRFEQARIVCFGEVAQ